MTQANAKWMWAALVVGTTVAWGGVADAQSPYVTDKTLGFESFCNGNGIPNAEFTTVWAGLSQNVRPVSTGLFASCGIESIDDIGQALGESAYLFRPALGQPVFDSLSNVNGTALMGNVGTGVGGLLITFRTPVNELELRVVDLDDGGTLTFRVEDDEGNETNLDYTPGADVLDYAGTFPDGIKRISLDYGGLNDNWAVDSIRFNTWSCGDGETETLAASGNPADEACDETNAVECDGCRTDCTTDAVGCLVDGSCVDGTGAGTVDPNSGGCALCIVAGPPATEVVGYNDFATAGDLCADDGLTCTTNLCDGAGSCVYTPIPDRCVIDGGCVVDGIGKPDSQCLLCDTAQSQTAWSPRPVGTACDDGDACTDETPDDASDDGDVCNDVGQCVGGAPLSCDDGLSCTVDSCNATSGCVNTLGAGCLIAGTSGDPICRAAGEQSPNDPCLSCQPSTDDADWTPIAAGETCGDPSCMAGTLTPAPTCNAAGECIDSPEESCDGATCADAVSCTGTCTQDSQCLGENYCEAGQCVPDKPDGMDCTRGGECVSGLCADGVCCNTSCNGVCEACNLPGSAGACTPHERGTDPEDGCPSEPEVQVCDGAGACIDTDYPDGTECTVAGECESGNCVDGVCCDAPCDGVCEACNVEGREGTCRPYTMQTDPENECEQACNGAGACVSYEVRGNGFCSARPWAPAGATHWPAWGAALLLGLWLRRRRSQA